MSKKKISVWILIILLAYFGPGILSAFFLEKQAERFMEISLPKIAKPWDVKELIGISSYWLLSKAKLTPHKIVNLSKISLGNFVKFNKPVSCNLNQGYQAQDSKKKIETYAICTNDVQFDKQTVMLKIRLIQENGQWKINDFISI